MLDYLTPYHVIRPSYIKTLPTYIILKSYLNVDGLLVLRLELPLLELLDCRVLGVKQPVRILKKKIVVLL